jgi:hypothetical protein
MVAWLNSALALILNLPKWHQIKFKKKLNKITYKTYFNDRLKAVDFHGKLTHPLYVQVTYERRTIFFKSYYFELFSKPRFFLDVPGAGAAGPDLELVIRKEHEVIDFVIEKHKEDFSLEVFKDAYNYYSKDVCDLAEGGFRDYLFTFFWDEGSPHLGDLVKHGGKHVVMYNLVRDFKRTLRKELYDKLVENSFAYAPPYLPLHGFMLDRKRWPELMLTMMEFRSLENSVAFREYMEITYPGVNVLELAKEVINLPDNYMKY